MQTRTAESPVEAPESAAEPVTPARPARAAVAALVAAADQLRADCQDRRRDRVLVDVLTVDLLAVADWLDRRAWLLSFAEQLPAPAEDLGRRSLDDDDELLPVDESEHVHAYGLGSWECAGCGQPIEPHVCTHYLGGPCASCSALPADVDDDQAAAAVEPVPVDQ